MKLLILAVTVMSFAYGQTNSTGLLRSEGVLKFKPTHRGLLYQSDSNGVFTYNREEIDNLADSFHRVVSQRDSLLRSNLFLKTAVSSVIDLCISDAKAQKDAGMMKENTYNAIVKSYTKLKKAIVE